MLDAIEKIAEYGIPTNSFLAAIQYLNSKEDLKTSEYNNRIETISGVESHIENERLAKYTFLYLVQETIRKSLVSDVVVMTHIVKIASEKAKTFINNNPWVFAKPEEEEKLDANGNPKRKKGAKQEGAARIYEENKSKGKKVVIELFMEELDMSKAGATTYFYNMKKKFGD